MAFRYMLFHVCDIYSESDFVLIEKNSFRIVTFSIKDTDLHAIAQTMFNRETGGVALY